VWPAWPQVWVIRATARVCEVAPNTGLQGWVEAAEPRRAFAASFLGALHREQRQLDAVYAVVRDRQAGESSDEAALQRLERAPYWGWTAMDPQRNLLGVVAVGSRTVAMAQRVGHQGTAVGAPGCGPLFRTDGRKDDATARLPHCGPWRHPERRQEKGPRPQPRWMPLPALRYAPVVQSYRRWHRVGVQHRVVFGTRRAMEPVVAPGGWTINPALVARLTRDSRQGVAAIGRRVHTLWQGEAGGRDQLGLCQVYPHGVLPHASLRQALDEPIPTPRMGAARWWRPCPPTRAAGLTAHRWGLKAMVFDRVPPWPQEQTVSNSLPGEERGMRGSVCAEAGQGAWTRAAKWVGRADHRLRDCSPTASEGSEIFIRKPEVRDLHLQIDKMLATL